MDTRKLRGVAMETSGLAIGMIMFIVLVVPSHQANSNVNCIRRACDQDKSPIVCNQSLILISDVTNWRLERDHMALDNMKKACMGRETCNPSTVCSEGRHGTLFIHYFCEDPKNVMPSKCNGAVHEIQANHGSIQSPNYPARLSHQMPCRWRIRPPNDSLVVLTLHDVTTSGPREKCDGGLMVSGLECEVLIDHAPRLLCGGDNVSSVVRCGKVDIKLSPSKRVYPLRFWLSFHVHPIAQPSSLTASLLTCSGWIYSMNAVTTEKVPMAAKETDTQLLIILLSVISSLSATLLVVLVIVCIRCRLIRMSVSDHVYSEPSPALQAHYDYISSLETDKPHPQLADEYFEVADALPYNLRDTPASPAYAEVEQFIDFKKGQWSSMDSAEWADCQSQGSNPDTMGEDGGKSHEDRKFRQQPSAAVKMGPVQKLKADKFNRSPKQKHSVKLSNTSEPKVFIVNLESNSQNHNVCDDSSPYEQIEIQTNGENTKVVFSDSKKSSFKTTHQPVKQDSRKSRDGMKNSRPGERQKLPPHSHQSRVDQIKEGLLSKHGDRKEVASKKKDFGGKHFTSGQNEKGSPSANNVPKKKSPSLVDSQSSKNYDSTDDKNTKQKPLFMKERLQTSGIVRNGIQKFEQN